MGKNTTTDRLFLFLILLIHRLHISNSEAIDTPAGFTTSNLHPSAPTIPATLIGSKARHVESAIDPPLIPIVIDPTIHPSPSPSPSPSPVLRPPMPPTPTTLPSLPPPLPAPSSLSTLIAKVRQQLHHERDKLYSDAFKTSAISKTNEQKKLIQTTKTSLLTHVASSLLSDKIDDDAHMVQRLSKLHNDRLLPCGTDPSTPCAPLSKAQHDLRVRKMTLSDADRCDEFSHTSCANCTALPFCGWCAAERTCLEGNADAPRFGDACTGSWYHVRSTQCLAFLSPPPVIVQNQPHLDEIQSDLTEVFDPACASFAGSPGDCERAKLRMESVYVRCLAEGRTNKECTFAKATEAKSIAQDQLRRELKREKEHKAHDMAVAKKALADCISRVGLRKRLTAGSSDGCHLLR